MNRNGTHRCIYCQSTAQPRLLDETRGARMYRLAYCPACYAPVEAWERDGHCLSPVPLDALMTQQITMLDLGEAIAPGRRSIDPLNLEAYRVDAGELAEAHGVPFGTPLKVS